MRRKRRITVGSKSAWNRLVDHWFSHRLLQVLVIEPPRWRYPFSCDLRWDSVAEQWSVGIVPGWCESPAGEASPTVATIARLCPLAALRLGEDDPEARVIARLDESPRFLIPAALWRAEGTDAVTLAGSGAAPLPDEITKRGVLPPVTLAETESGLVERVSGLVVSRNEASLARAMEVFIEHGREVVSIEAIAAAGAVVDYQVTFRLAAPASPRIGTRKDWPAAEDGPEVPPWSSFGNGVIADEGIDRRRIATLWVTSPPAEPQGSAPDGRWRPYIQQYLSRNLAYEVTGPDVREIPLLRLDVPGALLAGGAAASIIGSFAGDLQSRANELDAKLAGTKTTGGFVPL
jgi:hypothetical protein